MKIFIIWPSFDGVSIIKQTFCCWVIAFSHLAEYCDVGIFQYKNCTMNKNYTKIQFTNVRPFILLALNSFNWISKYMGPISGLVPAGRAYGMLCWKEKSVCAEFTNHSLAHGVKQIDWQASGSLCTVVSILLHRELRKFCGAQPKRLRLVL